MKKEDLRVIKTKKNLYEGLIKTLKDKPFEEIRVSDICEVSLVNRSTFYDHFSDKYELLSSLIKDLEEELKLKLEENEKTDNIKDYYLKMIELLLEHINEHILIYSSILKNNNNSIASDMFRNTLLKDVEKNIKINFQYQGKTPPEIITIFYVSGVINVCIEYIKDSKKYTKEDILKYLNKLIPNNF